MLLGRAFRVPFTPSRRTGMVDVQLFVSASLGNRQLTAVPGQTLLILRIAKALQ